jgi:hypothetical protein
MNLLEQSFLKSRQNEIRGCLIALAIMAGAVQSEAALYSTSYSTGGNTYGISYDSSVEGFSEWSLNGLDQLGLQSLYISINGGPVTLLASTSVSIANSGPGKQFTIDYAVPGGVGTLRQTAVFAGNGIFGDTIRFQNTSGGDLGISLFQYSQYILGNVAGDQSVSMTPASGVGSQAFATQTSGSYQLTFGGQAAGYSTLVQADGSGAPFGAFIGSGTDLDNTTLTANHTSAVFGYEFYGTVANGNFLTISETAGLAVPEPSSMALVVSGLVMLASMSRARRSRQSQAQC